MEKFAETLDVLRNTLANKDYDSSKNGSTKQSKRRTKALKAKIAKIKNADLTERYSISEKIILEQKISNSSFPKNGNGTNAHNSDENEIVNAIKRTVLNLKTDEIKEEKADDGIHSNGDINFCSSNCKYYIRRCPADSESTPIVFYQKPDSSEQKYFTSEMLDSAIDYLRKLLQQIITVYQNHWKADNKKTQSENIVTDLGNHH